MNVILLFRLYLLQKVVLKNENLHNVYTNDSEAPRAIENEQQRNERKKAHSQYNATHWNQ